MNEKGGEGASRVIQQWYKNRCYSQTNNATGTRNSLSVLPVLSNELRVMTSCFHHYEEKGSEEGGNEREGVYESASHD